MLSKQGISKNIVERSFQLKNSKTKEDISKIKQLHYKGWPDHGVPKEQYFNEF